MRAVIQRVKEAQVRVAGQMKGQIAQGLLIFLGVAHNDSQSSADYLIKKITEIFPIASFGGKSGNPRGTFDHY